MADDRKRVLRARRSPRRAYSLDAGTVADETTEGARAGSPRRRFFRRRGEIEWLPVSEPAFLLWVLAFLSVVWFAIGAVLFVL